MIKDSSITEYINELKSAAPTPGGGGVAALNSAQGVALIMMVANITLKNEKYSEWHKECKSTLDECQNLLEILINGIDDDAEEFNRVITGEEEACIDAAKVPLKVMKASLQALELDNNLLEKSNPSVKSDLYVAARSLQAGLLSSKYNVDANIPSINKIDSSLADEFKNNADELVSKCNSLIKKMF